MALPIRGLALKGGETSLRDTISQSDGESNTKEENAGVHAYVQRAQDYDGVIRTEILACGRARSRLWRVTDTSFTPVPFDSRGGYAKAISPPLVD